MKEEEEGAIWRTGNRRAGVQAGRQAKQTLGVASQPIRPKVRVSATGPPNPKPRSERQPRWSLAPQFRPLLCSDWLAGGQKTTHEDSWRGGGRAGDVRYAMYGYSQ